MTARCGTLDGITVRPGTAADLALLAAVELAANSLFPLGTLPGAMALPLTLDELRGALRAGWLWVAESEGNGPVGFAVAAAIDPALVLLLELDVHPAHGRRGIGAALVHTVAAAARARGYRQLGLTTFEHLPWNAPMYQGLGFVRCTEATMPDVLREELDDDEACGLRGRCAMVRDLALPLRPAPPPASSSLATQRS